MRKTRNTAISVPLALVAFLLVFASCSDDLLPDTPQQEEHPVQLSLTRAGSTSGTTYRTLLYSAATSATYSATGTYRDPDDPAGYLTPCTVNATSGEWTADNTSAGLRAGQGTYMFAIVSPAKAPTSATIAATTYTGYMLTREPGINDPSFTLPISLYVSGLALGGQYVYHMPETVKLVPMQAKVQFKFTCGDDVTQATVKGFAVNNVIAEGLYRPQAARFEPVTTENLKLLDDSSDPPITLNRDDALYTFSEQWILPMDYSPVDTQGNPLYTAPMLEIKNGDLTVRYQLLFHYKPLHKYTYNFVINSNNITPHLTISMWQDGGATDTDTSPLPLETITLPAISLGAWQPGGTDSDVIN